AVSPSVPSSGSRDKLRSVHLEDWPVANKKLIDGKLGKEMEAVRKIVGQALAERARAGIKVRQPLSKLKIKNEKLKMSEELLNLIRDEINVKKIVFDARINSEVELDTEITPELREEGDVREIIRCIQGMRKEAGLQASDEILVGYSGPEVANNILEKNRNFILKEARVKNLVSRQNGEGSFNFGKEVEVGQEKLLLGIKKVR
ncbi:MAG: DUF5915 domain-containing protein, partial [Candidatus Wildermuthbacteria bacterium]|nr:DUF5915 domain-containing protein [Candidatus Wildermuthbacteria bacterium]